ncbi:unnamed protein product [Trichobilharzia szidati]|nr:unnamed protein product [Trichobilharzia szidati]
MQFFCRPSVSKCYRDFRLVTGMVSSKLTHGNATSPLEQLAKLQELADRWPSDTCNRKVHFKDEIKRRITECLSKPTQELDANFWEAEYQSLSRLLKNHHQNNYTLPSGLGGSRNEPAVAATGADLKECRRILSESETVRNSLLTRIISKFIF